MELADFLECDERSASRYLAGDRFPSGPQFVRFFEDDVLAPKMVTRLLERLPAERRKVMAQSLIDAADLIRIDAEIECLTNQKAKVRR